MKCTEAERMVIPYLKDELNIEQLDAFLEHIETCDNCMEELEIHYMVDVGLKKLDQADATYDIVGDLRRKLESSCGVLRRFSAFQILRYSVSTLTGMSLLLMFLLQVRLWHEQGFLFF